MTTVQRFITVLKVEGRCCRKERHSAWLLIMQPKEQERNTVDTVLTKHVVCWSPAQKRREKKENDTHGWHHSTTGSKQTYVLRQCNLYGQPVSFSDKKRPSRVQQPWAQERITDKEPSGAPRTPPSKMLVLYERLTHRDLCCVERQKHARCE